MNLLVRIINLLINLLFPIECLICEKQGLDICSDCIEKFQPPKKQNFPWIVSLGNYHDKNMETIMRHIKRQPNERATDILAKAFSGMILNRPTDPASWIIIPIPIYKTRFRERGYNQSELLAKSIAKQFGFIISVRTLKKIRHTKKQGTSKSKEERMHNIANSFSITTNKHIMNKNIILIDDIATTGSTLSEARKTLLAAGAKRVMAWTVAN